MVCRAPARALICNVPRRKLALCCMARPTRPSSVQTLSPPARRCYATKSSVDEVIERIQDQYATAKDEFEMAYEETEKRSVYAESDRGAAREELDKLNNMFSEAIKDSSIGEEIRNRVGGRIRELDNAVKAMEKLAVEQD